MRSWRRCDRLMLESGSVVLGNRIGHRGRHCSLIVRPFASTSRFSAGGEVIQSPERGEGGVPGLDGPALRGTAVVSAAGVAAFGCGGRIVGGFFS